MHIEHIERKREVSLGLNERVFISHRQLKVPVMALKETAASVYLPLKRQVKLDTDCVTAKETWEPRWIQLKSIDSMIEASTKKSNQPYLNLLNDALAEVSKLEGNLAAKKAQQKSEEQKEVPKTIEQVPAPKIVEKPLPEAKPVQVPQKPAEQPKPSEPAARKDYLPNNRYTQQIDDYQKDFDSVKAMYDNFLNNGDMAVKQARIDIAKRINTTVNTLAGTQKQVELSHSAIVNIINDYRNERMVVEFVTFRVIDSVLNCCDPGCQMYLNPKSVWPFAYLLRGLMSINPNCRAIYYTKIKKSCAYIVPRLYQGKKQEELEKLHGYSKQNDVSYIKKQVTLLRLHIALMVVTNDVEGLWAWFAGFVNSCYKNVLKQPLSGILVTAMSIGGHLCLETYKDQFKKVVACCHDIYESGVFKVKNCEAADMYNGQLSQFLEQFKKTGTIDEPEGIKMKQQEEELHEGI
ncbi:hypothetical protein BgAZ_304540 [Babesia gibsoni]|uniref:mRNA export factor GLE1 n=1 Tax=Babesia gibsoni TaxID=33632 RepID=A0AAD8PDZ8_BABGI|nr:hypothetical protein BgAZ_304540 [Babesia gibsoni]